MADPLRQPTAPPQPAWIYLCRWLWNQRKFVWGVLIVGIIVGVSVNWLTSSTSIFAGTPLGTMLLWIRNHLLLAGFIGMCLLFLTLLVGVVSHLADTSTRAGATSGQQQSRHVLIRLLRNEYRRQMSESLQGAAMMALALRQRTDMVLSSVSLVSWRMDMSGEDSLPAPTSIVQAYDDSGFGLLILGAPGAGKSTLLRELASELLRRVEDDATQPVPVIVNLSSWAIKKPSLKTWLVDQLQLVYAIPQHLSQAWIEQDQLLLLLDGLDEVESSARTNCIEVINAYRAEHFIPIVVCSRSHEYLEQEERLRLPVAVEVQPLTAEQVNGYLKGAGKPMSAVRSVLRSNTVLHGLITTPLMLSVVMLAYRGKTVKDLPQLGSAVDQQRQVFEYYVTRMLEGRMRKWHYASYQTRQWLIWLAQQMKQNNLTEFYLEHLQPTWLSTKRLQILYIVFGGFVSLPVYGPRRGYQEIRPQEILKWSWKDAWSVPAFGLVVGLAFGLVVGLVRGLFFGLIFGLFFGLFFGLGYGMLLVISVAQLEERVRLRPNQGIQSSGENALRMGLVGGIFGGVFGALVGGVFDALVGNIFGALVGNVLFSGWAVGIFGGLFFGLGYGLAFGGVPYLLHYLLRYLLWRSGALPWHYVRFLEEAHERILLQRVGGGYRFIHPLLQDYFASLGTGTSANAQSHP